MATVAKLSASVGPASGPKARGAKGAAQVKNQPKDVALVRTLLISAGYKIKPGNKVDNATITAIRDAQKRAKAKEKDGILHPGDKTMVYLSKAFDAQQKAEADAIYVKFDRGIWVSQKEYEVEKARALRLLEGYSAMMHATLGNRTDMYDRLSKVMTLQDGFAQFAATTAGLAVGRAHVPKRTLGVAATKALRLLDGAIKAKDFKKIDKALPAAEKAVNAWNQEMSRWWTLDNIAKDNALYGIAKSAGWLAMEIFQAPAGSPGGAAFSGATEGACKGRVDLLEKQLNGQSEGILVDTRRAEFTMAQEAITGMTGFSAAKVARPIAGILAPRMVAIVPGLRTEVATRFLKRALSTGLKGMLQGIADELMGKIARRVDAGRKPPKPKTWNRWVAARVWDALLAGIVGEMTSVFTARWNPGASEKAVGLFEAASTKLAASDAVVRAAKPNLASGLGKIMTAEAKHSIVNAVVGRATGKESAAALRKLADVEIANSVAMRGLVEKFLTSEMAKRAS